MFFHLKLSASFLSGLLRVKASTSTDEQVHKPRLKMIVIPTRTRLNILQRELKILEILTNEFGNIVIPLLVLCGQEFSFLSSFTRNLQNFYISDVNYQNKS